MVGAPTYEGSLFPPMTQVMEVANTKRIKNKQVARFGSYGWSGGAQRRFEQLIEPLKWDLFDSFEFKGGPTDEDLRHGEEFGARFARHLKEK